MLIVFCVDDVRAKQKYGGQEWCVLSVAEIGVREKWQSLIFEQQINDDKAQNKRRKRLVFRRTEYQNRKEPRTSK